MSSSSSSLHPHLPPSMSTPPEVLVAPEKKKQMPSRVVEDVGRIRGALSDTTHLLDSFKDSLGDIVVASKASNASIGEMVGVCKEERREAKVVMERIDQHIQQQSHLPSDLASLRSLSSTAASEQTLTSQRLEKVESALVYLSTKVSSFENFSTTLSTLSQTQTDLSTAGLQLSSTVTQISNSQTQISQTQASMLVLLQRLDARPSPPQQPGSSPNIYVKILDGVSSVLEGSERKRRRDWEDGESAWDAGSTRGGRRSSEMMTGEGEESRERSESARTEEGGSNKRFRADAGGVGEELLPRSDEDEEVDQLASSSSEDRRQVASFTNHPPSRSESDSVHLFRSDDMGSESRSAWRDPQNESGGGALPSSDFDQHETSRFEGSSQEQQRSSPPQQHEASNSISRTLPMDRGSSSFAVGSSSPPRKGGEQSERELSSTSSSASKKKPLVRRKRKENQDEDIIPFNPSPDPSLLESPIASKSKVKAVPSTPMPRPLSNHNSNVSPASTSLVAGPSKPASTSSTVGASKHLSPATPFHSASSLAAAHNQHASGSPISSSGRGLSKTLASSTSTSSKPPVVGPPSSSLKTPITPLPSSTSIPKPPTPASATPASTRRHRILIAEDEAAGSFLSQSPPSASQSQPVVEGLVDPIAPSSSSCPQQQQPPPLPPLPNFFGNSITPPSAVLAQPPLKRKRMLLMGDGSTQEDEDEEEEVEIGGGGEEGEGDAGMQALEKAMKEDEEEGIGSLGGSLGG